jgi:hypothetical protein
LPSGIFTVLYVLPPQDTVPSPVTVLPQGSIPPVTILELLPGCCELLLGGSALLLLLCCWLELLATLELISCCCELLLGVSSLLEELPSASVLDDDVATLLELLSVELLLDG